MKKLILLTALLITSSLCVQAQFLKNIGKKIEQGAKKKIDKNVDEGIDKENKANSGSENQNAATGNEERPSSIKSSSKFDFVPGEKILYSEDFEQDAVGELPLNWNASGKGEVVTLDKFEGKWLRLYPNTTYLSGNKKTFGENYTIEFDAIIDAQAKNGYYIPSFTPGILASGSKDNTDNSLLKFQKEYNAIQLQINPAGNENTGAWLQSFEKTRSYFVGDRKQIDGFYKTLKRSAHYAIQVQKQRFRIWIDGEKIYDVPKAVAISTPMNQLYFNVSSSGGYNESNMAVYIKNIKIATGIPDTRSKLITEGKFSTTGILFDVNSDKIKPESAGVLKEIADVLKENEAIKIKIIGHTDSDGKDADNLSLSKRRAAAVKKILETDYGIEGSRMQTDGKGESAPVVPNTTKEGKAQNRRVEFIKL